MQDRVISLASPSIGFLSTQIDVANWRHVSSLAIGVPYQTLMFAAVVYILKAT